MVMECGTIRRDAFCRQRTEKGSSDALRTREKNERERGRIALATVKFSSLVFHQSDTTLLHPLGVDSQTKYGVGYSL